LKLQYDEPLSNITFNFNLRRYTGVAGEVAQRVRLGIILVVWSFLPCLRSTLWSFTPNDVDDTGLYQRVTDAKADAAKPSGEWPEGMPGLWTGRIIKSLAGAYTRSHFSST